MDQNKELRDKLTVVYRAGAFVFVPFARLPEINGLFIPVSERVVLSPDDFYSVQGKFGMHHFACMKLSDAAGVNWSSEMANVGRTDNRSNPHFCSFRVVAKIRTPEGLWLEQAANKHLDIDAKKDAISVKHAESFDYKSKYGGGKGPNGWDVKKPWPKNKEEYVEKFTSRDVNQLRDNMDERCESGAQVRAIKNLIHLPTAFPPNPENKKQPACMEFHIVRYILDPQNQLVQAAQLASFNRAISGIYGAPPEQLPAPLPDNEPKDVTPIEQPEQPSHPEEDSMYVDFENLSFDEKINTINNFIEFSDYEDLEKDIDKFGKLEKWKDKQLIDYFKHLKDVDAKRV